jgi:transcriptional regulator with XRE-family HTH domain
MKALINPRTLSKTLFDYRESHPIEGRRMSQEHLAMLIGVPRYTLQRWENVRSNYSVKISPIMLMRLKQLGIVQ